MRARSLSVAWAVMTTALLVPTALASVRPAAACSFAEIHVAPYSMGPGTLPAGSTYFTATVTDVGDGWMDVTPDYVAYGDAPTHLTEEPGARSVGTCGGSGTFEADAFDPGWTVVVSGSAGYWFVNLASTLEEENEVLRVTAKNEIPAPSGQGAPAVVVGGTYGHTRVVVLDGNGQPIRYITPGVAPQTLVPCPESPVVVAAGMSDKSSTRGYGLDAIDTSTGAVEPIGFADSPSPHGDDTFPWVVGCANPDAKLVLVAKPVRDPRRDTGQVEIVPHGDRVLVVNGGADAVWDRHHGRLVVAVGGPDPHLELIDPRQPILPRRIPLNVNGRIVSNLLLDPMGTIAVVSSSEVDADDGGAAVQVHAIDLDSDVGVVTHDFPRGPIIGTDPQHFADFLRPDWGVPSSTQQGADPGIQWASPAEVVPLVAGTVVLAGGSGGPGIYYRTADVWWHARGGSTPKQVLRGVSALAIAPVTSPGYTLASYDRFWPDPAESVGRRATHVEEGVARARDRESRERIVQIAAAALAATGSAVTTVFLVRRRRRCQVTPPPVDDS